MFLHQRDMEFGGPHPSSAKMSPLFKLALRSGVMLAVKLHLSKRVNLDCRDAAGRTPLLVAAEAGHLEVCRTLLAAGADPTLSDHIGRGLSEILSPANLSDLMAAFTTPPVPSAPEPAIPDPQQPGVDATEVVGEGSDVPTSDFQDAGVTSRGSSLDALQHEAASGLRDEGVDFVTLGELEWDAWTPASSGRAEVTSSCGEPFELSSFSTFEVAPDQELSSTVGQASRFQAETLPQDVLLFNADRDASLACAVPAIPSEDVPVEGDDLGDWEAEPEIELAASDEDEREFARSWMDELAGRASLDLGEDWDEVDLPQDLDLLIALDLPLRHDLTDLAHYLLVCAESGACSLDDLKDFDFLAAAHSTSFGKQLRDLLHVLGVREDALPISIEFELDAGDAVRLEPLIAELASFDGILRSPRTTIQRLQGQDKPYRIFSREREQHLGSLIAGSNENSQVARNLLALSQLWLIKRLTQSYRGLGLDLEDLYQIGFEGAMRAAEKWDPVRGYRFGTYVSWWIRQALSRSVADLGRTVRLPVHAHETLRKLRGLEQDLARRRGCEVEDLGASGEQELAQELGLTIASLGKLRERSQDVLSLNSDVVDDGSVFEQLASRHVIDEVEGEALRETLFEALESLPERECEILLHRFGLETGEVMTLEEIGAIYGLTRERIRQIERKALIKLSKNKMLRELAEAMGVLEPSETLSSAAFLKARGVPGRAALPSPARRKASPR